MAASAVFTNQVAGAKKHLLLVVYACW